MEILVWGRERNIWVGIGREMRVKDRVGKRYQLGQGKGYELVEGRYRLRGGKKIYKLRGGREI